jgi:hypothetical protein
VLSFFFFFCVNLLYKFLFDFFIKIIISRSRQGRFYLL